MAARIADKLRAELKEAAAEGPGLDRHVVEALKAQKFLLAAKATGGKGEEAEDQKNTVAFIAMMRERGQSVEALYQRAEAAQDMVKRAAGVGR